MRVAPLLLLCLVAPAYAAPPVGCPPAIAKAEDTMRTAPGLLAAIGIVESGRKDPLTGLRAPWPWTVTAEGVGVFYPGKAEAIRAVQALQARGVLSIDVGCLQVNLLHHPGAFRDLDEAFDPAANTLYAARFLSALYLRLGSWPAATAGYHSLNPDIGGPYGRLVAAVWAGAPIPVAAGPGGTEVVTFPGGGEMRIIRDATSGKARVLGYMSGP
jgi:hypothetical protein